jgi:hypothetical protein
MEDDGLAAFDNSEEDDEDDDNEDADGLFTGIVKVVGLVFNADDCIEGVLFLRVN